MFPAVAAEQWAMPYGRKHGGPSPVRVERPRGAGDRSGDVEKRSGPANDLEPRVLLEPNRTAAVERRHAISRGIGQSCSHEGCRKQRGGCTAVDDVEQGFSKGRHRIRNAITASWNGGKKTGGYRIGFCATQLFPLP